MRGVKDTSKYEQRLKFVQEHREAEKQQLDAWKNYNWERTRLNLENSTDEDYQIIAKALSDWDLKTIKCDEAKNNLNKYKNLDYYGEQNVLI
jgi:hypothetical protein